MALHAKPSGAYTEGSADWNDNILALWEFCYKLGYTAEAFSGMMGNAQHEGGLNPWRWEGDTVNTSHGYGLFQYTPASGYLDNYGKVSSFYAPNLSTTSITSGANPDDGYAQIDVIEDSGKFFGGGVRDTLVSKYVPDYSNHKTINGFKTVKSVHDATYLWLSYFEMPGWWYDQTDVEQNAGAREQSANAVFALIGGTTPGGDLNRYGAYREIIRRLILHA